MLAVETGVVELHFVLGWVAETYCLFALALVTSDSAGSAEGRVLDIVFLVGNLLLITSLIALVHTVELFVFVLNDFLESTYLALEGQLPRLVLFLRFVLERIEHVVTLLAESHAFVSAGHEN